MGTGTKTSFPSTLWSSLSSIWKKKKKTTNKKTIICNDFSKLFELRSYLHHQNNAQQNIKKHYATMASSSSSSSSSCNALTTTTTTTITTGTKIKRFMMLPYTSLIQNTTNKKYPVGLMGTAPPTAAAAATIGGVAALALAA